MNISVQSRSGRVLSTLKLPTSATVADLKCAYEKSQGTAVHRQRFTLPVSDEAKLKGSKPVVLSIDQATLASFGVTDKSPVVFKDLGPQISWQTVFIIEYFGPMVLVPGMLLLQQTLYGAETVGSAVGVADAFRGFVSTNASARDVQVVAATCWFLHFLKRELETLFVHRFSNATMPLSNLFKNCTYYWGFAALVGYFCCHPLYTPVTNHTQRVAGLVVFAICELCNLQCHVMLRNLRPAGSRVRKIPRGFAFELVSCPNYLFEILAWLGFNLMTQTVTGYAYMFAGAFQMLIWAAGKHRNYRREFDGKEGRESYPRGRKIIVPFLY